MNTFQGCDPAILKMVLQASSLKYDQTSVSYVFTCPRCSGKKKLYIRKKDGRFVCWRCKETDSYQGRPEFALADLLGQPVKHIRSLLYGGDAVKVEVYLDVRIEDFFGDDDEPEEDLVEIPRVEWPYDYYPIDHDFSTRGAEYLRSRQVTVKLAKEYGIHYSPIKRRVVFPVEAGGELYGWQERTILPTKWVDEKGEEHEVPKILSSTGIPRDKTLMFADRLRGSEHAVITEGPIDAIKAHLCGGNVAAMGKAVSTQQIELLVYAGVRKLYLGLDPDAAEEIQRLVRQYNHEFELYEMLAPSSGAGKADLGAMFYDEVYELFRAAPRVEPTKLFVYFKYQY